MKMSGYSRTKEELRKRILSRCDGRFRSSAIFNVAEWVVFSITGQHVKGKVKVGE